MVCSGPDPPDSPPLELRTPRGHEPMTDDSDDEVRDYAGYEQLPQGPGAPSHVENDDDDEDEYNITQPVENVPPIEPMERELTREVWNAPRPTDGIPIDQERAQQVMSAMANFVLPEGSIPAWAQCISEEQWQRTLQERIQRLNPPQ